MDNKNKIFILLIINAFIGLVIASIGIDFYNKCKKNEKLSVYSRNFLVLLLVVFILILVYQIWVNRAAVGEAVVDKYINYKQRI